MLDRKIRYCSLPEAIREHFLWGARSIVIAGTHGKTTTTALTGWLLTHGGVDPSVLVGGIARNFGEHGSSYRLGQGRDFVIEGDEYDSAFFDKTAKFLKYLPDIAVINNVEFDHADIYPDIDAVTLGVPAAREPGAAHGPAAARRRQPGGAGACKAPRVSRVETFGTGDGADWQAHDLETQAASTRFRGPARRGSRSARSRCRCSARTTSGTRWRRSPWRPKSGISAERIAEGSRRLPASSGGSRSSATPRGVTVYDDFAHHPTAVAETLRGPRARRTRRRASGRCSSRDRRRRAGGCSRTTSRARSPRADEVVLAPVFRSTLPEAERLSVPAAGARSRRSAASRRARRPRSTTSSTRSSASIGRRSRRASCRTAGSAASIRSCCRRCS